MGDKILLVSDLDGTLLGDDAALERFAAWHGEHRDDVRLIYATGRFFGSVKRLVETTPLPEPFAVIGEVGTRIIEYDNGVRSGGWPPCWIDWCPEDTRIFLKKFGQLRPQPPEFQTQYKLSYFADDLDHDFLVELQCQLTNAGYEVEVVYSSGRCLDILPSGVNKGSALTFLLSRPSFLRFTRNQVIVAGDDGNDVSMLVYGFRGVVVGNARPELRSIRRDLVYHSPFPFADGVLDGLRYWLGNEKRVSDGP